jgi:hypothetical protein
MEEVRDGFLGRMLLFISKDDDPEIDDVNSRISQPPHHIIEKISALWQYVPDPPPGTPDIQRQTGTFQVTIPTVPDAQERFLHFRKYARARRKAAADNHDATALLWGRAEENARKVALIVAAMDAMTMESAAIAAAHADYACRLMAALMDDFAAAVGDNIADSKVELTIRRILRWVKEAREAGLLRKVVSNRIKNPRERNEAVDDLLKEGEIFEVTIGGKKTFFAPPYGMEHLDAKLKRK